MRISRALQCASSAVLLALLVGGLGAQKQQKFALTIENIMRGPQLYGYEPHAVRWSGDSQRIYFQWKQAADGFRKDYDTYVVGRDGSGLRKLSEEEARLAPPLSAAWTRDHQRAVYSQDGDLYLYDYAADRCRRLTRTLEAESSPRFTRDEKRITFLRGNNLYAMSLEGGLLEQLTDVETGAAAPGAAAAGDDERKGTDSQEYIKKEQRELLDAIKERARQREQDEARRKKENPRKPWRLAARQSVASLQLSGDEKYVVALVTEAAEGAKNTIVANYVTESAYTEDIGSRAKAGDTQSRTRLAILRVDTGEVKWVEHGIQEPAPPPPRPAAAKPEPAKPEPAKPEPAKPEPAKPETAKPETAKPEPAKPETAKPEPAKPEPAKPEPAKPEPAKPEPAKPEAAKPALQERAIQLFSPVWSADGSQAVVQGRAADNKDRWIFALDADSAKLRPLVTIDDDAWVDGPGSFTVGWLADDATIYYESERDGWAHLYTVAFAGGEPKQLTSGKWEVTGVRLSRDRSKFYLTSSEASPFERHLYAMEASGGERVKLTSRAGSHEAVLSPDEQSLALVSSYTNQPPELYVQANRPGADMMKLTSSPAPEFFEYAWQDTPIVGIPARDGVELPAQLFRPAGWRKGGPAVIFVHGAGYMQNVHKWWSSYAREYLFHHLLMERGYIVLNVDYRASAGYGRDWRTAVYRHMGGKDLDDQVDAARWLTSEQGVDARRIGLYGGSYGGFLTLMAMFTQPDLFAAGAALRPVTDWAHYAHFYSSAILNNPQKDSEAYKVSSPIYHAAGLKGALLICHGMVDTNVHFQDTVRLVEKLIELHKDNWELAVYPVEDHAFQEPASWTDEYQRIFKLFETHLKAGAAPAPAPEGAAPAKTRRGSRARGL